ncbi:EAL domain-containing protein [Paractinoplanes durhamensis]|uniref:EAL domain-containing protein n=1 Tax=Paractinoplanes durhamensis TaxID=113563 RepID=UPI001EF17825|nr:transporter substrate-binding domain-containing protein [Actinoplanes durhamensis]
MDADEVRLLLESLRSVLTGEMVLDGVPLTIEASFGIALYPEHGDDVEELLRHADAAMYQGKRGTADIVVYTGERTTHPTQWLVVQAELRHALERDELVLFYQPKVRLADGSICGVEALVRWQHPERGLLPPSEFLPAAEQSGLIEPLTAWVLRRALADQAAWTSVGRDWTVSVNVSARNLEAALDKVADGTYDGVLSAMTDTVDREKKADFVDYFSAGTSIIVQRGNPRTVADLSDLCGNVVAIEKGTIQAELLHRSQSNCAGRPMKINEYSTNADALLQLRTGRAVAVLNDFPPASYLATDSRTSNYYQLASATQYETGLIGIPFAKNNSQLRDAVKGALDRVISAGAYADLLQRWGLSSGAVKAASINGAAQD